MLKRMLAFSRDMFCWHTGTPVKESYLRERGQRFVTIYLNIPCRNLIGKYSGNKSLYATMCCKNSTHFKTVRVLSLSDTCPPCHYFCCMSEVHEGIRWSDGIYLKKIVIYVLH